MSQPEGFDEFWQFWRQHKRHTDGPGKCRKEYARQIKEGATPEDLLIAADWHVRNTKDLAFIPLAATWLHSENWRDEAPKEREFRARLEQRAANVVQMPRKAEPPPAMSEEERERRRQQVGALLKVTEV
jgi:hypothetical protein